MTIRFNSNYNNYNMVVGQKTIQEEREAKKTNEKQEVQKSDVVYRGLKNETDLLTQNTQNLYGVNIAKFTLADKEMADETNAILAQLGYNYKVTASQVASVSNGVKNVVMPVMKLAEDGAVESHIKDPNGPFADLFA